MKKVLFLLLISILFVGCSFEEKIDNPYYEVLLKTEKESFVDLVEYNRYGKHLNITIMLLVNILIQVLI